MTIGDPIIARKNTGNIYNVKDFGAVGDGSTNDQAAISAAVSAAGSSGTIYFPSGTYLVNSTVTMTSRCAFVGESRYNSCLKTNSNIPIITMDTTSSCSRSVFQHLRFQGIASSGCAGILITGSSSAWTSTCLFNDLCFDGIYYGIRNTRTLGSGEIRFDWNTFSDWVMSGSVYSAYSSAYGSGTGNVYSNIVGGTTGRILAWEGGDTSNIGDILISGLHSATAQAGVYLGSGGSYHQRVTICNAQFDAGVTAAFDVHGAYGNLHFYPILFGGNASYYLSSNPTNSIIQLPTGLYGYSSSGTRSTIYAY